MHTMDPEGEDLAYHLSNFEESADTKYAYKYDLKTTRVTI